MRGHRAFTVVALMLLPSTTAEGQQPAPLVSAQVIATPAVGVIEAMPFESVSSIRNAPFSAEAVTEFTQVLGDGNRIERRYSSMIARDSQGRTRREEEIALVGPLAVGGASPRLVTIVDAPAGATYTLDESQRIAFRNPFVMTRAQPFAGAATAVPFTTWAGAAAGGVSTFRVGEHVTVVAPNQTLLGSDSAGSKVTTESLGKRTIEGVAAEGTRTTTTLPAGAIGNVLPIEIVSERWYSPELQMPVLISRRDPRTGDSIYRLSNILRAEPPPDLFTVPPDYTVRQGGLGKPRMVHEVHPAKELRP